jgi:hypothetical protein
MQVTIGSTLSRAWDQNQEVDLLVEGHWFTGRVTNLDGMGVSVDGQNFERYVLRLENIAAVRIRGAAHEPALSARLAGEHGFDDVA